VNAASSGATIYVCAGTYTENVTIDEPLTLDGAEFGQGVQTRAGGESVVSSVSIGTSNVSVDGFSFNGRTSQVSVNSPTTLSGSSFRTTSSTATAAWAPHLRRRQHHRPEEPLRERLGQ